MSKNYKLNPVTLLYENVKESSRSRVGKMVALLIASLALSCVYFWLFTSVFGFELPKTILLKKADARWASRMEVLNRQLDIYDSELENLCVRDEGIYRNIFGMNSIPDEVRNAGFGGVNRYSYLDMIPDNSVLKNTSLRLDKLTKKTYMQSKSFDEVETVSKKAGDMASRIPAVPPIAPDPGKYRLSSSFGYRTDPVYGISRMHTGFDFACKPGTPVYATGEGTVESVRFELFGYGNSIVIDHGFGYKTRYAHLKVIYVAEGMTLKRGQQIGESGNSGKSTGPHLHYEVMLRGRYVNPYNYFDMSMPLDEYNNMIANASSSSDKVLSAHMKRAFR